VDSAKFLKALKNAIANRGSPEREGKRYG
jgi:hypothetical protein